MIAEKPTIHAAEEKSTDAATSSAFSSSREAKIVLLFCVLAAVHVFIFSAAFPFFTNVDEPWHFDLIVKCSHGHAPRGEEMFSGDSSVFLGLFNSWEYLLLPKAFANGKYPPPIWTLPATQMSQELLNRSAPWRMDTNYEVSQTPLYYALAGLWWRAGQWLGLKGGHLLYSLRFLNILFVAPLVWLGYAAARKIFPDNSFARLGVPMLLVFIPQPAFYSLGNDVLSPLCFGATFICLLKWLPAENPTWRDGVATGFAFAATYLAKATNLPLLIVAVAVVAMKTWQSFRKGTWRATLPAVAAFFCCTAPPMVGWMIWSQLHFGDVTGSKFNIQFFGWTIKPLSEWWHHPIFTPSGFWTYLSGQLGTFWQGEIWWHKRPLALHGTNLIYTLFSIVLLIAVLPALVPRFSTATAPQRQALQFSMACFIAGMAFFALLSIVYDFHNNVQPSKQHPYFTSGRLLLGALIPFLLLIVYGLDRLLSRFENRMKFFVLGTMISAMLVLEVVTDSPVFSSGYNWFHLP